MLEGLRYGLRVGLILAPLGALLGGLEGGLVGGLVGALACELALTLFLGLVAGLIPDLELKSGGALADATKSQLVEATATPNQNITQSVKNGTIGGLILGLASGLGCGLLLGLLGGPNIGLIFGLVFGAVGGLTSSLYCGGYAAIQHFVLRILLTHAGHMPWRYTRFLDYATERIFLRKVGGGYIFVHRMLQEYFASLGAEEIEQLLGASSGPRNRP